MKKLMNADLNSAILVMVAGVVEYNLKLKKTMTVKALAANRANARKSTGPRRTEAVSQNARKHGLLSKKFIFESEEEKHEFEQLLEDVQQHEDPVGPIERVLVEETAVCIWKLQMANGREVKEFENRRVASDALMQTLAASHRYTQIPLFTRPDGTASDSHRGWECQELLVRCDKRDQEEECEPEGDRKSKAGQVHIEAKMITSLDSILRYQTTIKRDLYRVLSTLRELQRERKENS